MTDPVTLGYGNNKWLFDANTEMITLSNSKSAYAPMPSIALPMLESANCGANAPSAIEPTVATPMPARTLLIVFEVLILTMLDYNVRY